MRLWLTLFVVALVITGTLQCQETAPPLHTFGYQILDAHDRPVQLLSVNWYGFDEKEFVAGGLDRAPLATIVSEIRAMGFNSVRLPWANEVLEHNPAVGEGSLTANPELRGKHSMELMDAVIQALTDARLMVILDNHMSDADWCCNEHDDNGLWYNAEYPESIWIADWQTMARRYAGNPWVIGADLRNELRSGATWGGTNPGLDWHAAAERGGNAVLAVNPKLLIFVEGPRYSTHLEGFGALPVVLSVPHRLVYSPHSYGIGVHYASYEELAKSSDERFGYLLHTKMEVPVWVGEFGACQTLACGGGDTTGQWMRWWMKYCRERHMANLSYWALNGTESAGTSRKHGKVEFYGLLDPTWQKVAAPEILKLIHAVTP
jgi:endoglucanase